MKFCDWIKQCLMHLFLHNGFHCLEVDTFGKGNENQKKKKRTFRKIL